MSPKHFQYFLLFALGIPPYFLDFGNGSHCQRLTRHFPPASLSLVTSFVLGIEKKTLLFLHLLKVLFVLRMMLEDLILCAKKKACFL